MVCVWCMPYISYATYVGFLNPSISLTFSFPSHAVMEVLMKNECSLFTEFKYRCLTVRKKFLFFFKNKPIFLNPVAEKKPPQGQCSHLVDWTLVRRNWCNLASISEAALITCACESESRFLVFWPVLMFSNDSYSIVSRRYCAKEQPCVHSVLLFVLASMCGS